MSSQSLFQFLRGTARNDVTGYELDLLLVVENNHLRPCSDLESRLYNLLRETTQTAMDPKLKERIWAVIGDE